MSQKVFGNEDESESDIDVPEFQLPVEDVYSEVDLVEMIGDHFVHDNENVAEKLDKINDSIKVNTQSIMLLTTVLKELLTSESKIKIVKAEKKKGT